MVCISPQKQALRALASCDRCQHSRKASTSHLQNHSRARQQSGNRKTAVPCSGLYSLSELRLEASPKVQSWAAHCCSFLPASMQFTGDIKTSLAQAQEYSICRTFVLCSTDLTCIIVQGCATATGGTRMGRPKGDITLKATDSEPCVVLVVSACVVLSARCTQVHDDQVNSRMESRSESCEQSKLCCLAEMLKGLLPAWHSRRSMHRTLLCPSTTLRNLYGSEAASHYKC